MNSALLFVVASLALLAVAHGAVLPCLACGKTLLTTTPRAGEVAFASDVISTSGACATRTLVCNGKKVTSIEFNHGANGSKEGGASTSVTLECNAAGTAWLVAGNAVPITAVTCSAF